MARFLIGTVPAVGHVNPALPIARKLVERGHEVWWYTGKLFQPKIEATGACYVPMNKGLDASDFENLPKSLWEQREKLKGFAQFKYDIKTFMIDPTVSQMQDYVDILRSFPADVLLSDSFFLAGGWVSEQQSLPYAEFSTSVLAVGSRDTAPFGLGFTPNASKLGHLRNDVLNWILQRVLLRDVINHTNDIRASVGLLPHNKIFFDKISPFLYLQGTVPSFEYPRSDLPPQVHFVGPFLSSSPTDFIPPAWWDDLKAGKPVIHVTQGTVSANPNDLIVPTLQALAHEDVLVIATTGGYPIENIKLQEYPTNARIEPFIPHFHLLPHVDIMITNGGYNAVQMALANGVSLVVAGKTEDKPEVGARVEWSGVGINLKTKTPAPAKIKDAVKKILSSYHYRQKAKSIGDEISHYDAPTNAATLLEQLAETKQPVLRSPKSSY
ncbi:glycosyl transferase [Rivularia sp. IAM M-261]|nr:glycosyl transferase [Calothrix sp. PCC 7716]GJD23827.1 glycosyl transferase [Rivularia sp. IAM M-261]